MNYAKLPYGANGFVQCWICISIITYYPRENFKSWKKTMSFIYYYPWNFSRVIDLQIFNLGEGKWPTFAFFTSTQSTKCLPFIHIFSMLISRTCKLIKARMKWNMNNTCIDGYAQCYFFNKKYFMKVENLCWKNTFKLKKYKSPNFSPKIFHPKKWQKN